MKAQHVDGDTTITLDGKDGIYTITLCDREVEVRRETTASYTRAVYEYSQMVCFEMAQYAVDEVERANIETIPHLTPGSW